jgi:hypothetical protein
MFHKHSSTKDGLQSYCKPCHNFEVKIYKNRISKIMKDDFILRLSKIPKIKLPDIEYN